MSLWRYERITAHGFRRGACEVCGKPAVRSRLFEQTHNPFSRNEDGAIKTPVEIRREVVKAASDWEQSGPIQHARCEAGEPA